MTDVLDGLEDDLTADQLFGPPAGRVCLSEGCTVSLEGKHHNKKWCDEHRLSRPHVAVNGGRTKRDSAPGSVKINVGSSGRQSKLDREMAAVRDRAKNFTSIAATILVMTGQTGDAQAVLQGSDQWAESVAELAKHEDWIRRLAEGGEGSARAMAWLQFAIATGAILLPIFIEHELIKGPIAGIIASMTTINGQPMPTPAASPVADAATS